MWKSVSLINTISENSVTSVTSEISAQSIITQPNPQAFKQWQSVLSLSGGGGDTFSIPQKKLMGKVANFFYFQSDYI